MNGGQVGHGVRSLDGHFQRGQSHFRRTKIGTVPLLYGSQAEAEVADGLIGQEAARVCRRPTFWNVSSWMRVELATIHLERAAADLPDAGVPAASGPGRLVPRRLTIVVGICRRAKPSRAISSERTSAIRSGHPDPSLSVV